MAHADNLRRHFPAVRSVTYLNTAVQGLLPDVSAAAMKQSLDKELELGRTRQYLGELRNVRQQVKDELAHLVHASQESFALVGTTSDAVNLVLWGLELQVGDEVIVHTLLGPEVMMPIAVQKQRRSVQLRYVDGTLGPADWVESLARSITYRTRVVVCPQVCPVTGQSLPLEDIVKVAHQHHVAVIVDGSQGAGAMPIQVDNLNLDFYVVPANRWMCGPDGAAAVYVHPRWLYRLQLSQPGPTALSGQNTYDLSGMFLPATSAARFEGTAANLTRWIGWAESLQFMRVNVGWDYASTRIHGLSGELLDGLLDISGVKVLTQRETRAGIVSFQLVGVDPQEFVEEAQSRQIEIACVSLPQSTDGVIRISTGLYNNSDDISRLVKRVEEFTAKGR